MKSHPFRSSCYSIENMQCEKEMKYKMKEKDEEEEKPFSWIAF